MILIDTNVLSELRVRGTGPAAAVIAWLESIQDRSTYISTISVFEIECGIVRLENKDLRQAASLREWFEQGLLPRFADHILPVDRDIAVASARLHKVRSRPELNSMLAATALVHNLTLATRNTRDFADTGVRLINPWDYRVGTGSGPE